MNDDMLGCASCADPGERILLHGSQVDLDRVWELADGRESVLHAVSIE